MKSEYLKEKLDYEQKLLARNDFILKVFIAVFIIGYAFFFTSNLFFPKVYKYSDISYIGESFDLEKYALVLDTWDYSKKDNSFEVIFDAESLTLEDEDFDINCRKGDELFKTEIHKNSDGLLVVRVEDIPKRWTEVIMTIDTGTKSVNLHMNDKQVNEVSKIKDRPGKEYLVYSIERKIAGMKQSVKNIQAEVEKRDEKIQEAYEKMDQLEKKKKYQTDKQQSETDEQKTKISSEFEKLMAEQDEAMLQIDELNKTIEIQEKLLKNYR